MSVASEKAAASAFGLCVVACVVAIIGAVGSLVRELFR